MSHTAESSGSSGTASSRRWLRRDRPILAYGFMLATAVALMLNYFIKFPTLPDEAAAGFRAYRERKLPLQNATSDSRKLQLSFEDEGVFCKVRILDPATYTLKGGRVQPMMNRRSCWYAYQGPGNEVFVFQMFPGNTRELPVGAQSREDRGLSFHVYYRQDVTVVFWQENDLCCLLISDAAPTDVIRLAQASVKA